MTGEPASAPTETPAARPSDNGMVTGRSPLPTGLPSTNSLMFAGTPLPLAMSGLPVGVNSKLKMWSPSGMRAVRLHLEALVGDVVVAVGELAVLDVEREAAVVAAHGEQHAFGAALGHVGVHRHRMRHVDHARRGIGRHHLRAGIVDVLLAVDRDLRSRLGEAQGAAAVDRQHVVLAGLDVPHADHGDQPVALLFGEVVGLGEVLR